MAFSSLSMLARGCCRRNGASSSSSRWCTHVRAHVGALQWFGTCGTQLQHNHQDLLDSDLSADNVKISVRRRRKQLQLREDHHPQQNHGLLSVPPSVRIGRVLQSVSQSSKVEFQRGIRSLALSIASSPSEGESSGRSDEKSGAADVASRGWQIHEEDDSDWRSHAAAIARSIQLIKARLQWKELLSRLQQLDVELARPDVWQDAGRAAQCSRERGTLAGRVTAVDDMENELLEHVGLAELAHEENDTQVAFDATRSLAALRKTAKDKELAALLSGEHDSRSCFLEVQAGAGGTESMDWAAMVMRMYRMWAHNRGFQVTEVDEMAGEEAGIKRATIRLDGEFAYGFAKTEAGVHRLVRISPFDAGKRRHTSFAAVAVMPVLNDSEVSVQINEADLRIERYRAGGAGGQHVNKTESAVRIVHLPTGITVQCQSDRSQHRNKATALGMLQSRLYQLEVTRRAQASAQHTQALSDISWGNQIRSYVLQPYQMVKDLRTAYEVSDPTSVLDGDLDGFILTFLASSLARFGRFERILEHQWKC